MIKETSVCRTCRGPLENIIYLGVQKLPAWLSTPDDSTVGAAPLQLMRCTYQECSLVQLKHTVEPDSLYREYFYASGTNASMRRSLADLADATAERMSDRHKSIDSSPVWVDIGCNDGTLFRQLPMSFKKIGFDPSDIAANAFALAHDQPIGEGFELVNTYFSAEAYGDRPKAAVVTAAAMFYDLDDPLSVAIDINKILADDGIFVVQVAWLPAMLAMVDIMNICHEHLEYYSLGSLGLILSEAGLFPFDAELNEVNGGSIRIFCSKNRRRSKSAMLETIEYIESALLLDTDEPYLNYVNQVESQRASLLNIVNREEGQVWGYAASTKGNVLLQYCGLGSNAITAIADRNPRKYGTFTSGGLIPVVSEDKFRQEKPALALVLAYSFLDEFVEREKDWLSAGGRFIVPVPHPFFVGKGDI